MNIEKFDAVIMGGGVIGLTLAAQGVGLGQKILVVEKNHIGFGASGAGSGILMTHGATQFHSLFREMYVRSVKEYYPKWLEFLNEAQEKSGQAIGLPPLQTRQTGSWQFYSQAKKFNQLQSQLERESSQGFKVLESLDPEFDGILNDQVLTQGVYFSEESIIHNGELLSSLRSFLNNDSHSTILEGVDCQPIWGNDSQAWTLHAGGHYQAEKMILTSGAWVDDILRPIGFESRMTPVRGQLAWYEHSEIQLETSIHMDGHFYAIPREGGFILGATTEAREWKQEFEDSGSQFLKENIQLYLKDSFHDLEPIKAWAGLRPRTRDRKPLMGAVDLEKNLWMSAGHYKNGLSMAPLAAELMWDKILGNETILNFDEFSPLRQKGLVPL